MTAASEAVYLNEAMRINVHSSTWLERNRYIEAMARRGKDVGNLGPDSHSQSGYARETKTRGTDISTHETMTAFRQGERGVGLAHRQSRWTLTLQFLKGIWLLLLLIQVRIVLTLLRKLHIAYRPHWLVRLAESRMNDASKRPQGDSSTRQQPSLSRRQQDVALDVETFARERLIRSGTYEPDSMEAEEHISNYLYGWWKTGGKWGDVDPSGDYAPSTLDDDDTTSVISFSTTSDIDDWSDIDDEGQRTPTQSSYRYSREATPLQDNALDLARLSHLLDPQSREEREEARMLGRHLQSTSILTRSQYRKLLQSSDATLLASPRYRASRPGPLSAEDEEQVLEDFLLDRRNEATKSAAGTTWDSGAEGMGAEGPQCVVCQISPRTVLVWPCGCLSLCDECRVGLASKNYTTCVCCRTSVTAYSRLFVP